MNAQSAESHAGFAEKNGFTARMLVDRDFTVAKQYDAVMGIGPLRVNARTVVGIARDGTVAYYAKGMPSTDEIVGALTA